MLVLKDLLAFDQAINQSSTVEYGKDCLITHDIKNFSEKSRKWVRFIQDAVQEEIKIIEKVSEYSWKKTKTKISSLELHGWRMDKFYEIMEKEGIPFENKIEGTKSPSLIKTFEKPDCVLKISPNMDRRGFLGVFLKYEGPVFMKGVSDYYFLSENRFGKVESSNMEIHTIEKLANQYAPIVIGRNYLPDLYYRMLPKLEGIIQIQEEKGELIRQYLPQEAKIVYYLDAVGNEITVKVFAFYGEDKYSCLEIARDDDSSRIRDLQRRQISKEELALSYLIPYFPEADYVEDMLHSGNDEEIIYQFISQGVDTLSEIGEVRCTKRFKKMNFLKQAKVRVGVSVESNLLDLDITTENLTEAELLDILSHYKVNQKYFRLKSGEFVELENESLQLLIEMMETMHLSPKEFVKGKMHLPAYRSLYLDKMLEEYESVYSVRDQVFREMVKNMKSIQDSDFDLPDSLEGVLRKYQKNGFRFLRTLDFNHFGGILADDMGLGKTLQMISVLLSLKKEGETAPALIVAPASLVYNWQDELQKFAPKLSASMVIGTQTNRKNEIEKASEYDVLVTSYDLLKRDIDLYADLSFSVQVIDEAQYIKNHTTAQAKAVKIIRSKTKFALTGTPIENRLSELWSIFDYLMPGFLFGYDTFKKQFETPIVKSQDEKALKRLQKMVAPFILRRLKNDVLKDLPDKLEETRVVSFEGEQQKVYDAKVIQMKKSLASQDDSEFGKNKLQILAELTRLRQICCDPALCFENYKGESAKLESCMELIQSAIDGGHKILLFSQFTSMLEILENRLTQEKIAYYKITGDTSKDKRLEMVKKFNQDDVPLFLISLKAGGVGLNLTGADVVIHYDPWWNLAVQNQATDRAHRIGQTKKVTVYKMIVKNTIEEKILKPWGRSQWSGT